MRKLDVRPLVTPKPIVDFLGAVLLALPFAIEKKEPAGINQLSKEARKMLSELEFLRT